MVRLCSVVSLVTGERASYVFDDMPLRLAYHYEQIFLLREGYRLRRPSESLVDLL